MKPVIFGLKGTKLSQEEIAFFKAQNPFGFILFKRNCESTLQVKALVASLKELAGRDILVFIDQEGGRVQRLKPPICPIYPPAKVYADLYARHAQKAKRATFLGHRLLAEDLYQLGINANCAPCADLLIPEAHDIIGDRAFGKTPEQVSILCNEALRGLNDSGVYGVIKHLPGHGRALVDSHEDLPIVSASHSELKRTDFAAFKGINANKNFGMTAHAVYTERDEKACATFSQTTMKSIRKACGFTGLLMSDDLSMKALSGTFESRTQKAMAAGCDIALHCNGEMEEMTAIAGAISALSSSKTQDFLNASNPLPYQEFDKKAALSEYQSLTGIAL